MHTIDYIKQNGLDKLQEVYAIKANLHEDGRVILNYDQIESYKHKTHPIVRECRGLVLDSSDWSLVARSFERFFNLGLVGWSPETEGRKFHHELTWLIY